jgi:hypothetical protein
MRTGVFSCKFDWNVSLKICNFVSYAKPKICVLHLNHISIRIFHQSRPSSATQPYCGARRLWGVPHTNRLLKAIAGSGFDAVLCADVYNLYVKRNISSGGCIFTWGYFNTVSWIAEISTLITWQNDVPNHLTKGCTQSRDKVVYPITWQSGVPNHMTNWCSQSHDKMV